MVFILDDDPGRIGAFQRVLDGQTYHIERTVPEAVSYLESNQQTVSLYSLDNDLYVPDYPGDPGEGWQLCEWILSNCLPKPLICHSSNPNAAVRMELACQAAGWEYVRMVPCLGHSWIEASWIHRIKSLLRHD